MKINDVVALFDETYYNNIGIGFGADVNTASNVQSISSDIDNLEPEDLVKYGLIPDLT